jgi:hypothetical protein
MWGKQEASHMPPLPVVVGGSARREWCKEERP